MNRLKPKFLPLIAGLLTLIGLSGASHASDALFIQLGQPEKIQEKRYQSALAAESSATHARLAGHSLLAELDSKLALLNSGETLSLVYLQDADDHLEDPWLLPALSERLKGHTDENTVVLIDLAERPETTASEPISRLALRYSRDLLSDGHVFVSRPEFAKSFEKKMKTASVAIGMLPGYAVGMTKIAISHQYDLHSLWIAIESAFPVSIVAKSTAFALLAKTRTLRAETLREGTYLRFANGYPVAQMPMRPGYAKVKLAQLRERSNYANQVRTRNSSVRANSKGRP